MNDPGKAKSHIDAEKDALRAEIARLRTSIETAHNFLTSDPRVTYSQRIANASVTLADALD